MAFVVLLTVFHFVLLFFVRVLIETVYSVDMRIVVIHHICKLDRSVFRNHARGGAKPYFLANRTSFADFFPAQSYI